MYYIATDPHPGRCLNVRHCWGRAYRCLDYEGSQHVCSFDIPETDPDKLAGNISYTATAPRPEPWVRPGDSGPP